MIYHTKIIFHALNLTCSFQFILFPTPPSKAQHTPASVYVNEMFPRSPRGVPVAGFELVSVGGSATVGIQLSQPNKSDMSATIVPAVAQIECRLATSTLQITSFLPPPPPPTTKRNESITSIQRENNEKTQVHICTCTSWSKNNKRFNADKS